MITRSLLISDYDIAEECNTLLSFSCFPWDLPKVRNGGGENLRDRKIPADQFIQNAIHEKTKMKATSKVLPNYVQNYLQMW